MREGWSHPFIQAHFEFKVVNFGLIWGKLFVSQVKLNHLQTGLKGYLKYTSNKIQKFCVTRLLHNRPAFSVKYLTKTKQQKLISITWVIGWIPAQGNAEYHGNKNVAYFRRLIAHSQRIEGYFVNYEVRNRYFIDNSINRIECNQAKTRNKIHF